MQTGRKSDDKLREVSLLFPLTRKLIQFSCLVALFSVPTDGCIITAWQPGGTGNRHIPSPVTARLWDKWYKAGNETFTRKIALSFCPENKFYLSQTHSFKKLIFFNAIFGGFVYMIVWAVWAVFPLRIQCGKFLQVVFCLWIRVSTEI